MSFPAFSQGHERTRLIRGLSPILGRCGTVRLAYPSQSWRFLEIRVWLAFSDIGSVDGETMEYDSSTHQGADTGSSTWESFLSVMLR